MAGERRERSAARGNSRTPRFTLGVGVQTQYQGHSVWGQVVRINERTDPYLYELRLDVDGRTLRVTREERYVYLPPI
jgi:hypothetical protein